MHILKSSIAIKNAMLWHIYYIKMNLPSIFSSPFILWPVGIIKKVKINGFRLHSAGNQVVINGTLMILKAQMHVKIIMRHHLFLIL